MNLYLVVSEELSYVAVIDSWLGGPTEYYRIADMVVARSHGQARWLAWKNDKDNFNFGDIREMPKMAVRLKRYDEPGPARIVTREYSFLGARHASRYLWDLGPAPHIGL